MVGVAGETASNGRRGEVSAGAVIGVAGVVGRTVAVEETWVAGEVGMAGEVGTGCLAVGVFGAGASGDVWETGAVEVKAVVVGR